MIKCIRQNKILNRFGWMNDTVFLNETNTSDYSGNCVFLTVISYLKKVFKKMSLAIECIFREFKEQCRIENALINKFIGPKKFKISIQCIEKNMDIYHERRRPFNLCLNTISITYHVLGT